MTDIDTLLAKLTLEEKIAQLGGVVFTDLLTDGDLDETKLNAHLAHGIGQVARPGALSGGTPERAAELTNAVQRFVLTHSDIPVLFHDECLAGFLAQEATTFPQPIGLGCTWQPELIGAMAETLREQMRAVGVRLALSPVMDVCRDLRWGRTEETYGEDPFLTTQYALAYVTHLQADLSNGVAAMGKHFVGHGQPLGGRNWAPVNIPERDLFEVHLTPFAATVQAGLATVMTTYHSRDGVPSGADGYLTNEVLRERLGFDGLVASDYHNTKMLREYHHVAGNAAEAAAQALLGGTDAELPKLDQFRALKEALSQGFVSEEVIDQAVRRVLALKAQLGLFDESLVASEKAARAFNTPEQRSLSRTLAQQSIVLLQNDGLLPLNPTLSRVAVIGPSADSRRNLQGDYHFPTHLEDLFSERAVNPDSPNPEAQIFDRPLEAYFPPTTTVLEGVRAAVSAQTEVTYAKGCEITGDDASGIAEAVRLAEDAEVAVVVVGERSGLSSMSTSGESRDRTTLGLLGVQQRLLEAVHATGTPTVVVLMSGRPLSLPWVAEHIPASLYVGVPAQEGGQAVADILFGQVNPGGKLCVTIPRNVGQLPLHIGLPYAGTRSHWRRDYVDSPVTPLYAFGHGLSYTTFNYDDLKLSRTEVPVGERLTVSVTLENSGERTGDEVVQLYVRDITASLVRPLVQLVGFKRVRLEPGQRVRLEFNLDTRLLAFYDHDVRYMLEPGEVQVMVGGSSANIRLQKAFTLIGERGEVAQVFSTPVEVVR